MEKIKVLVTASTFPRYKNDTSPRFILDLCKSIEAAGDVTCLVLAPHSKGSSLNEKLEGIQVNRYRYMFPYSLEKISGMGIVSKIRGNKLLSLIVPFFLISQFFSTFLVIKKYRPDIIVANWIIPQGLIAALIKMFFPQLKIAMVSHGGDVALIQKGLLLKLIGRFTFKKADKVIAVSCFIRDKIIEMTRFEKHEISVIPMGVDDRLFENCRRKATEVDTKAKRNLLFVGRLEEKKGIQYLIKAMSIVKHKYPDTILKIVGEGTLKNELISMTVRMDLKKNIHFIGSVEHSQLPFFFEKAMIFIAPSINLKDDFEGLPVVLLEAIASGIPIITTDAGGITDIIENNVTGILVQQRNADQLAEKIIELIEGPELRVKLSQKAFEKLKGNFTYSMIGRKYQSIIESVCTSNAS